MKLRNLFVGAVAAVFALAGCQEKEQNLGTPDISISTNELTFDVEGGEQAITVNAKRDWKVETDADWVVVDPAKGPASADDQTVTVTVLENTGMDRSADLKFTIGMKSQYLTVSQAGPGGSPEALIVYANDLDGGKVEKIPGANDATYWPYLDQSDVWRNEKGTGIDNLQYTSKDVSIRSVSSTNNLFFPAAKTDASFSIQNLELGSVTSLQLTFDASHGATNGYKKTFANEEFKVYVSKDNAKWVELSYDLAVKSDNEFDEATARFTVADTDKLSIGFKHPIASADGYRLTNIVLSVYDGQDATAIDFSKAVDMDFGTVVGSGSGSNPGTGDLPEGTGEGTLDSPYDAAKATKVASALADGETKAGVYVKGIVKSFKDVSGIAQYGNISYYITDADGAANFYVFRGKYLDNAKFTSEDQLKIGDEVVVYGDLINYMGNTPELAQGNYIVSLNSSTGGGNSGGGETPSIDKPTSLVKATVAEFLAAAEDDTWYELTGEIVSIETGNAYGNFTIKDATGEVYIYGMTSKWVGSNDKSFASLGLKETDIVTLGTLRGSYNGQAQGGGSVVPAYYISHVPGAGLPEDPSGTVELTFSADTQESVGSYTSDWSATIGTNSWRIVNFNNNNNKWSYIKCGHKATSNTATITTKNALAGTITSVVVQVDKIIDASKCTTKLEVASDASFSNIEETVNVTIAQGAVNYTLTTPRANCYYRLVFDCVGLGGDTNGNVQISKVKYLTAE